MARVELQIDGMSCQHCVGAVRRALEGIQGGEGISIEAVSIGAASVDLGSSLLDPEVLRSAVAQAGYPARLIDGVRGEGGRAEPVG